MPTDLARQLVAAPWWEWRQGLVLTHPAHGTDVIRAVDADGNPTVYDYSPAHGAALRVRAAVRWVVHGCLGVAGAVQDATRGMETLARALGEP
jgi:hypothetical protein